MHQDPLDAALDARIAEVRRELNEQDGFLSPLLEDLMTSPEYRTIQARLLREVREDSRTTTSAAASDDLPYYGRQTDAWDALISCAQQKGFFDDLTETWGTIGVLVKTGQASRELAEHWRRHLVANEPTLQADQCDSLQPDSSCVSSIWQKARDLIQRKIAVAVADDLGPDLYSVVFSGPRRHTLVFSTAAASEEIEREFMYYHMFHHLLIPGHLPRNSFGMRLEYRRGKSPRDLLPPADDRHVRAEDKADQLATCTLHKEYVAGEHLTSISREAVRGALRGGATVELIRHLLRTRMTRPQKLVEIFGNVWDDLRRVPVESRLPPPLPYCGPLRVVKGVDRPVYVIGQDARGNRWKRWVCSLTVLARLGLTTEDVEHISEEQIDQYADDRPLLDPNEVDQLRTILTDSILNRCEKYLTPTLSSV